MFDLDTWKRKVSDRLPGWKMRWNQAGSHTLYGFLAALSLWPLVEAAQSGQVLPVAMTLGSIAAGVGGNLLAEQVLRWKDRSAAEVEDEVVGWAAEQSTQPEMRDALDAILLKLDLVPQAQAALAEADRLWFQQELRGELARLGNLKTYEAVLSGVGAIAQDHSLAAGRDLILTIYQQAPGRAAMEEKTLAQALVGYLEWVEENYGKLNLRGIERRDKEVLTLQLDDVYVSLKAAVRSERKEAFHKGAPPGAIPSEDAEKPQMLDMEQLLALGDRLVIIGGPGSGKTTFLHIIASTLARSLRTGHSHDVQQAWNWPLPLPLPIFVSLADYNRYRREHDLSSDPRQGTLLAFISYSLIHDQAVLGLPVDFFERLLMQGHACLLLLDGLDEVANERERELVRAEVEKLASRRGIQKVLVTSRTRAYQGQAVLPEHFRVAEVQPMTPEQVNALVQRWCDVAYNKIEAEKEAQALQQEIADLERLRAARGELRLVDSPLLVTIVAIVHYNFHRLPEERAELYEKCVDRLLSERHKPATTATHDLAAWGGTLKEKREWLAFLAFQMMSAGEDAGRSAQEDQVKRWLHPLVASRRGEAQAEAALDTFAQAMRERGSLLDERGGEYRFLHLSFQEYLCAYYLAESVREIERIVAFLEAEGRLTQSWWRETVLLTAEYLGLKSQDAALSFVRRMAACPANDSNALAGAELSGAALLELASQDATTKEVVVKRLVSLVTDPNLRANGALRGLAGAALARLGDPRPGIGLDPNTGLPDIAWCFVPAGPFLMGSTKDPSESYMGKETPQHTLDLPAFWLSQYPITNNQYHAFVQAGGYKNGDYWTVAKKLGYWRGGKVRGYTWNSRTTNSEDGWFDQPADYGAPYTLPNHPVVGVSWFEALAYTEWLTEALTARRLLPAGWRVRPPSEAEWEKAARGGKDIPAARLVQSRIDAYAALALQPNPNAARIYPWGDDPDPDRANYADSGAGAASAVGCFPAGASPYGCHDLSGNVWEWTRSLWGDDSVPSRVGD